MVFTISCSGEDGKAGKAGNSCTIGKNSDDTFYVYCDDGFEAPIGERGPTGGAGSTGSAGKDGTGCWLGEKDGGNIPVLCGPSKEEGEVKGSIGSCVVLSPSDKEINIKCGSSEVGVCIKAGVGQTFDPSQKYCDAAGDIQDIGTSLYDKCGLEEKKYNTTTHYCGYASQDDADVLNLSVLPVCGKATNDQPNVSDWNSEYCRWVGPKPENAKADTELCPGDKKKINENSWKGEYCGWGSSTATFKTLQTKSQACLIKGTESDPSGPKYKGPNEDTFARGYCEGTAVGNLYYTEQMCGTSSTNKPNEGKWKHQYCGYEKDNITKKVYDDACDEPDSEGNPTGANAVKFNKGYCKADRTGRSTYTDDANDFCGCVPAENFNGCAANTRMNEGTWKGEYCGKTAASTPADQVYKGICDDDNGPNTDVNASGYCMYNQETKQTFRSTYYCVVGGSKKPLNEGSWKGEYCGYSSASSTANDKVYAGVGSNASKGACEILSTKTIGTATLKIPVGANYGGLGAITCEYDTDKKLTKEATKATACTNVAVGASATSNKVPNKDGWAAQYCGYVTKDATGTTLITVTGPGADECAKLAPKSGSKDNWNAYCAVDSKGKMTISKEYCGSGTSASSMNEGSWKGQYCTSDNYLKVCNGGLVGDPTLTAGSTKCVQPLCSNVAGYCEDGTECTTTGSAFWLLDVGGTALSDDGKCVAKKACDAELGLTFVGSNDYSNDSDDNDCECTTITTSGYELNEAHDKCVVTGHETCAYPSNWNAAIGSGICLAPGGAACNAAGGFWQLAGTDAHDDGDLDAAGSCVAKKVCASANGVENVYEDYGSADENDCACTEAQTDKGFVLNSGKCNDECATDYTLDGGKCYSTANGGAISDNCVYPGVWTAGTPNTCVTP